jgi:hypothetical protein
MTSPSTALDPDAIARAKALLERSERRERIWPVLGAAALLAISAITFATAMVMAPPLTSEHPADQRSAR